MSYVKESFLSHNLEASIASFIYNCNKNNTILIAMAFKNIGSSNPVVLNFLMFMTPISELNIACDPRLTNLNYFRISAALFSQV